MANIPLQSISFPGLSDKYTTPVVDNTLTQAGAAADAKKTGDEIGAIKNDLSEFPNGNHPEMGAGYANQLVSGLKKEDSVPYNFRAVPYDATLEEVKKIVGGTVVWNQLIQNGNFASGTDNWQVNNGTLSAQNGVLTYVRGSNTGSNQIFQYVNTTVNHVLFGSAIVRVSTSTSRTISMRIGDLENTRYYSVTPNTWTEITTIKKANINNPEFNIYGRISNEWSEGDTVDIKECMCFDIAQIFGTSIADYVYSLETATAGAGVAWLKKHFPKQFDAGYQAYDAGTLKSIEGLTAHETVVDDVTHSYALDSDVVLRGIPKLDSNNQLYYDGDEYLPDGTINRKWGERAYQSDDASDGSTMITDGTKTVYKLTTPTTETADPYTTPQIISPDGTEEYVYENGSFELPVGHSSDYPIDVSGQLDDILDTPSANGTYTLKATVTDGAVTYSWVADA